MDQEVVLDIPSIEPESETIEPSLVSGYDGERSPLQPPTKESTHYPGGSVVKSELITHPEGGSTKRDYYESGQLKAEKNESLDGGWDSVCYRENGNLDSEWHSESSAKGEWSHRFYHENGQRAFEEIHKPGIEIYKGYYEDGRNRYERSRNDTITMYSWPNCNQVNTDWGLDGSETTRVYTKDGKLYSEKFDHPDGSMTTTEYHPNGDVKLDHTRDSDSSETKKTYFQNRQLKSESTRSSNGNWVDKEYYEDGQRRSKSTYDSSDGSKTYNRYYPDGDSVIPLRQAA